MADSELDQSINVRSTKDTRKMLMNLSRNLNLPSWLVVEKGLNELNKNLA